MVRKLVICCALAGALGVVVGCTPPTGGATVAARDESAKDYKTKLDELDRKLAELKTQVGTATGDEKAKLETKIKDAGVKREAFVKKLDELKAAAADEWEGMKSGVQTAYEEFKKAVE